MIEAILHTDEHPEDMRYFGPQATGTAATISVTKAGEADVVLLLIAWRYGTIGPGQTKSYTELEYDESLRLDKPLLAFLADPATLIPTDPAHSYFQPVERGTPNWERLEAFRAEVTSRGRVVKFFTTPEDLAMKVPAALYQWQRPLLARVLPRGGPVAVADPVDLPRAQSFVGRTDEIRRLEAVLGQPQATGAAVVALEGFGGIGKSALAAHLVDRLRTTPAFPGGALWVSCEHLDAPLDDEMALAPLPETESERLFKERLRHAAPERPAERDLPLIAPLVQRLEGVPLAIELTAAYAGRQGRDLKNVLAEVTQDGLRAAGMDDKQRGLRARFGHSYEALAPRQQALFAALSQTAGATFPAPWPWRWQPPPPAMTHPKRRWPSW